MDLIARQFHFHAADCSSLGRRTLLLLPSPSPPRLRRCHQQMRFLSAAASRRSADFRLDCTFPALLTSKSHGSLPSSCVVRAVASPRPEPDAPGIASPTTQLEEPIVIGFLGGGRARFLAAIAVSFACGVFVLGRQRILVSGTALGGAGIGLSLASGTAALRGAHPKLLRILHVLKEQGLILAVLLGLSAFFSMAETSITTLWPWKVRELAEKEPEDGVLRMLSGDVTRFLTTILIGTTVVNIGATALVTEAATAIFGEAGVTAATGVMAVAILLLTEITPKSIAVHNATEVVRFVIRPVAWLSLVLYPVGRVVTFLSMMMLKMLRLKGGSEPYVTEDELKLMLRGAELSGTIEEEEQDMIENVLEIKDTHVKEVMTPLVDVVAIDAHASLTDFQQLWVTHQYSRVPVYEERIDKIIGIAYAMDMLEFVERVDELNQVTVREIARMPTYYVPDSMFVWNLLREFRIRQVHMAVVLNEYGGTIGVHHSHLKFHTHLWIWIFYFIYQI